VRPRLLEVHPLPEVLETLFFEDLVESKSRPTATWGVIGNPLAGADELVRRALVHRSDRGIYKVTSRSRQDVLSLLGEDAPTAPVLELLSAARPRVGQFWFFNGVGDVETYQRMLEDGLHGARGCDRGTVEKMQPGDLLLIYITEPYSEWISIQRVTGAPFVTTPELHGHHELPLRVPAEWVAALQPGSGIGRLEAADAGPSPRRTRGPAPPLSKARRSGCRSSDCQQYPGYAAESRLRRPRSRTRARIRRAALWMMDEGSGVSMGFAVTFDPILIQFTAQQREAWRTGERSDCIDSYCRCLPGTSGFGEYLVGKYWEQRGYRWIHHDYNVFGGNKPGKYAVAEAVLTSALGAGRLMAARQVYQALYPLRDAGHVPFEEPDLLVCKPDGSEIRFAESKRVDTHDKVNPRQVLGLFLLGAVLGCPVDVFTVAEAGTLTSCGPVTLDYSPTSSI
jgi:hypothetical protein